MKIVATDLERAFKALADATRRELLDRLHGDGGRTLSELCEPIGMTRQSVSQHLAILEEANLVTTIRRGREKLHYLNPVPLHEIQERWIDKFERPRLRALSTLKRQAEEQRMSEKPSFVYVTYIESTPERVWEALTDADLTARYWAHRNVSDWREGSKWEHVRADGSGTVDVVGTVKESSPPRRLVTLWAVPEEFEREGEAARFSRVTFDIEDDAGVVRLTVTHEDLPDEAARKEVARGWPAVLANLKTLLEKGHPLPRNPWEMP